MGVLLRYHNSGMPERESIASRAVDAPRTCDPATCCSHCCFAHASGDSAALQVAVAPDVHADEKRPVQFPIGIRDGKSGEPGMGGGLWRPPTINGKDGNERQI